MHLHVDSFMSIDKLAVHATFDSLLITMQVQNALPALSGNPSEGAATTGRPRPLLRFVTRRQPCPRSSYYTLFTPLVFFGAWNPSDRRGFCEDRGWGGPILASESR